MSEPSLDGLTLREIHRDLYRNIVSLRQTQDLFDDLSEEPDDQNAAMALELSVKSACFRSAQPIIDRPFEEATYLAAIAFPFDHWSSSRFSRGHYGVWYGSDTLETTIHETVYHWRNGLLADAGWSDIQGVVVERRVHLVQCQAALIDLTGRRDNWPGLIDAGHDFCQQLGDRIHRTGHPGVWTPSARCDGENAAIFTAKVLSRPRHHCYLSYRIERGEVAVYRDRSVKRPLLKIAKALAAH